MSFCTTCQKSIPDKKLHYFNATIGAVMTRVPTYTDAAHIEHYFCSTKCRKEYMDGLNQASLFERQ